MAESPRPEQRDDEGNCIPTRETANRDAEKPSGSLSGMFAQLLSEMKNINSGIAALHEARQNNIDEGELEAVEEDSLLSDDKEDGEGQDFDLLSLDTRVDRLVKKPDPTQDTPNPDILSSIAQDLAVDENTSEAVNKDLAGIVSSLLKERLTDTKLQQKLEKYPRPENVDGLKTPRINPLIWGQISTTTRSGDAKSQKSQHVLVGAVCAIVKATDHALKNGSDKELITILTDAMALVLQCNHDQNQSRRLAMKKDLHKDFAALCSINTPNAAGDYLFGDLSKLTKEISDANKLAKTVKPPFNSATGRRKRPNFWYSQETRNQRRFQPYQRGKNPFFDKGRIQGPRKKGNPNK